MDSPLNKPDKDILAPATRAGEVAAAIGLMLMAGFFSFHQSIDSGFFTARFGPFEMLCLYGPIALALAPRAIRVATGRRSSALLLESIANISLALGTLWLLTVFPFDFTHLMDVFPAWKRDYFLWVTDDIGRIPMIMQVVFMPIAAAANLWSYFSSRRQIAPNLS